MEQHKKFFQIAAGVAKRSLCWKDKCGAVIVVNDNVIASGFNAPPRNNIENRKCDMHFPSNRRKPNSGCTCCDHAEVRAIIDALKNNRDLTNSTMYFTRVNDQGEILFSGDPYCVECSKMALHVGITRWALWHEDAIKIYDAKNYNDVSFEFHCKAN
jgi:deoxycytidylate deaminase